MAFESNSKNRRKSSAGTLPPPNDILLSESDQQNETRPKPHHPRCRDETYSIEGVFSHRTEVSVGVRIVLLFTVGEAPSSRSSLRIKLLLPVIWFPLTCVQQVHNVGGGGGSHRAYNVDGAI